MDLTRRYFLKSTGCLAAYLGVAPMAAFAGGLFIRRQPVARGKTLVVIFLRGGADGLNLVVPFADPHYRRLRPSLALAAPGQNDGVIDLDGRFGLHPRLAPLKPLFDDDTAVAIHAVGYAYNTRSHFEEQDTWETGVIGNTVNSDGWLNRHLATSEGRGPIRAVSIGDSLPRILHGKAPAYAVRGLRDLTLPAAEGADRDRIAAALEHAYACDGMHDASAARDLLSQTASTTLDGMEQLRGVVADEYQPSVAYPDTPTAQRLREVARLIKADVGLEVAEVDLDGWDTHANQGIGAGGQLGNLAGQLAGAMAAFMGDLGDRAEDVVVVTMTDFGRTAAENGTSGTDHGWANCMLLAGGPVRRANRAASEGGQARKVAGTWPGLAPDQLHERRDLLHTTDFRDVIGELVATHLGNDNIRTILPSHEFKSVGLVRA
ncbi:MAG: DUF1501 domain-containing protein [Phycisphaerales bacterium]|nr:DUF1501 domain-containing protein [Phycisphaerales bacterium]